MRFKTEMWHPNSKPAAPKLLCLVFSDGKVCISILHAPGTDQFNSQEKAEERWNPARSVEQIILSVMLMLNEPNIDSPANIDAAKQYRDDPEGYRKKVRKLAQKSLDYM